MLNAINKDLKNINILVSVEFPALSIDSELSYDFKFTVFSINTKSLSITINRDRKSVV